MSRSEKAVLVARRPGQALTELALMLPFLLVMLLGLIEFGTALDRTHSLSTLSREGASIASRGASIDTVANVVVLNGADIQLDSMGSVIVTEVQVTAGAPMIRAQAVAGGFTATSRLGSVGDRAAALDSLGLITGQRHYAVEIFYRHEPITPVRHVLGFGVPPVLYDRTVF